MRSEGGGGRGERESARTIRAIRSLFHEKRMEARKEPVCLSVCRSADRPTLNLNMTKIVFDGFGGRQEGGEETRETERGY